MDLTKLTTAEFETKLVGSTYGSYEYFMRQTPEFQELTEAWSGGRITFSDVETFVNNLLKEFKTGWRFRYEAAMTAFVLLFTDNRCEEGDKYVSDLAKLNSTEIGFACGTARRKLQERAEDEAEQMRWTPTQMVERFGHMKVEMSEGKQYSDFTADERSMYEYLNDVMGYLKAAQCPIEAMDDSLTECLTRAEITPPLADLTFVESSFKNVRVAGSITLPSGKTIFTPPQGYQWVVSDGHFKMEAIPV
jgi:hypothetical protein